MLGRGQKWYTIIHFMVIKPRHALFCQGPAGCCVFCAIPDSPRERRRGGPMWPPVNFRNGFVPCGRFRPLGEFLFSRRKRNQNAAGDGLRWASPPIVAPPPDPRLRGIPLRPSAKFPAHKIRFQVLIPSGPLGPGSVQNSGLCHFTAAPGSDQPWQRVRDWRCAGRSRSHESGTGESGTRPYGEPRPFLRYVGRGKPIPYGVNGETFPAENRRAATQGRPHGDFRTFHRSRRYRIGFISCGGHRPSYRP